MQVTTTDFPPCFNETATLENIVCMLQCVYEQNAELMRHVEGIENAFKTVAESTTDMMANLSESPLGGLIGRFMGRGD